MLLGSPWGYPGWLGAPRKTWTIAGTTRITKDVIIPYVLQCFDYLDRAHIFLSIFLSFFKVEDHRNRPDLGQVIHLLQFETSSTRGGDQDDLSLYTPVQNSK